MKKRLTQSLIVILFLLIIFQVAVINDTKTETKYTKSALFGGCTTMVPNMNALDIAANDTVIVAEHVHMPTIWDSELYFDYVRMGYSDEQFLADLDLLAAITLAEAGNQPEEGKRWVVDTVLNRIDSDRWRDDYTIWETIVHPNQYDTYRNGAYTRVTIDEDIRRLVEEELLNRTNYDVIYFKTDGYFTGAPQIDKVGDHYFSGNYEW